MATFCPEIPLITGQQLLRLYNQAENKNPFGQVYIDFGVQINGNPKVNSKQAKVLLDEFKKREIDLKQGRVPDFNQLRIIPNEDSGLAYSLSKDASSENIAHVSEYPFKDYVGKNGLFGACLSWDGSWYAGSGDLHDSIDGGMVVRYDAEGVAPKKLPLKKKDLISTLTNNFANKF